MSSAAMKWVRDQRIAHPGLLHLVQVLAMFADRNGYCWRSQPTLADEISVSERSVRLRLAALEKLGVIQRAHRSNGAGGRTSDMIRLRLDCQFTITKAAARGVLQPANSAGSNPTSNRQKTAAQPANSAGEKGSDKLKVEIGTQEKLEPISQSALSALANERPSLRVVNGGRR